MKSWIAPAAALALGVMLGIATVRQPAELPSVADDTQSLESRAHSSAPLQPPIPGEAGFDEHLGRLLGEIDSADRDRLFVLLFQATKDRSMPPALARHIRKEILRRLVDEGAAVEAIDVGDERQREESAGIVAEFLAERDIAEAERFVLGLPDGPQRRIAVGELLRELGKTDPERGIALLRERTDLREQGRHLFDAWAERDPVAATSAAVHLEDELGGYLLHSAMHRWAMKDGDAAIAWMDNLPADKLQIAQQSVMNGLVNKDPDAALDTLLAKPELGTLFADWIGSRLARTVENANAMLERIPPGALRSSAVRGAARQLALQDLDGSLAWADTLLPGEKDVAIGEIFESLSRDNPGRAVELASRRLHGAEAESAIAAAARQWMNEDFESAFRALVSRLDDDALRRVLPQTLQATYMNVGRDLPGRLALVSQLSPETRKVVLEKMGTQWGMISPSQAFDALDAMPADDRAAFIDGLVWPASDNAPARMAKLAWQLPEAKRLEHAPVLVQSIAASDPATAAQFVLGLPAGDDRRISAAETLAREWVYDDPIAADGFVRTLAPGKERDKAALALAQELRNFDAERATLQLDRVSDPGSRERLTRELAEMWSRHDPQRGRELLSRAARSDAERRAIQQAMEAR